MLCLIPAVKELTFLEGQLCKKLLQPVNPEVDCRLQKALEKLPCAPDGVPLHITLTEQAPESYTLDVHTHQICITAGDTAGAFYAIQTLRQLLTHETVPCVHIADKPDFAYRGFYHDVTRGKLPTLDTLKALVDQMAYYKLNSLQLYIEHTLQLDAYRDVHPATGCYTTAQMQELDAYCKENFIQLIPSLSTFGHLYELLNQKDYAHLAVVKNYVNPNVWYSRMRHHTIDPLHPESAPLIGSMIDQTVPAFSSPWFNICGDETFDLREFEAQGKDPGQLYVDFMGKIIDHTRQAGKKVMMWADILLKHPETIPQLPEDVCFLNWAYGADVSEEQISALAKTGRPQIVCPGTTTWNRFCEGVDREEQNICRMTQFGHKHGAIGVLNTNWGDYGNICSLELSMYGLVLGGARAWSVATQPDDAFYRQVNALLYRQENAMEYLLELSRLQDQVSWLYFVRNYYSLRYAHMYPPKQSAQYPQILNVPVEQIQQRSRALIRTLSGQVWKQDQFRQEMLLAAEGICLVAELSAKLMGTPCQRTTDTRKWLERYRKAWLEKNQPNELYRIEQLLLDLEDMPR